MTAKEERIHTIKDFLSRPLEITTSTWPTTATAGTQLFTANFPEQLIANSMFLEKCKGFVGIRATLCVRVQVNSQPFQQGRLLLQYIPYAQYMPQRVELINQSLQGRTGCPKVDLDLSVGTEIHLKIPYVSPHAYYNLITGQGSFGAIYLVVYSQLRDQVSGSNGVEYTIFAHLEDVDIQYPTGANTFTGSDPNFASIGQEIIEGRVNKDRMARIVKEGSYLNPPATIFAQVGSELTDLKQNASPSSGLGQISDGLSTLSRLPLMGTLFTKPAWISRQASNIMRLLGYSKPTVQGLPCESKLRGQARMANFDGADTSHKLALASDNEIETKPGLSGTSADEMELTHVLSIPNFWDRFSWSTDNNTNAILWDNFVTPFKVKPFSDTILDRFVATHTGYVANAHTYWRGSLTYTFKFVKTVFHSGRLRISFIPYYYNANISTGVPDISRTQKIIVDMRTATEVSFNVPYISSRPWMFCIRPESALLGTNGQLMYNAVTGIVRVEVLNKLVAANNVYQSIDVIVEVNGGPDLTFAGPTSPSYVPYAGGFTQAIDEKSAEEHKQEYSNAIPTVIRAQVLGENEAIQRNDAQKGLYPMPIDTHNLKSNWSPEAACIGEKILSIRQLIKRFGHFAGITTDGTNNTLIIAPFSVRQPPNVLTSTRSWSLFEYYYYLYGFWRGSMRLKIFPTVFDNTVPPTFVPTSPNLNYIVSMFTSVQDNFNTLQQRFTTGAPIQRTTGFGAAVNNMGQSRHVVTTNVEGCVEFEVPYYNPSHISPATLYTTTPIETTNVLRGHIPPTIITAGIARAGSAPAPGAFEAIDHMAYRAPGDDFSFMYLLGTPPLVNVSR